MGIGVCSNNWTHDDIHIHSPVDGRTCDVVDVQIQEKEWLNLSK